MCGFAATAVADEPQPPPPSTVVPTELSGRVVDVLGKPLAKARVHAITKSGDKLTAQTDSDGRFRIKLPSDGEFGVLVAVGKVQVYRRVTVAANAVAELEIGLDIDSAGNEVITVIDRDLPMPAVKPRPENPDDRKSLPYSKEAVTRDAWGVAWVLIDLDERGTVSRLKLIKRPGFDLDRIAVEEAFKLKFEPARDAAGNPVRTVFAWKLEWPSWAWLVAQKGTAAGKPPEHEDVYMKAANDAAIHFGASGPAVDWAQPLPIYWPRALSRVPCAGSSGLELESKAPRQRDCSKPNLANDYLDTLPWITRDNIDTALAVLDRVAPLPKRVPSYKSKAPAWIATGVTGLLAVGLVGSVIERERYASRSVDTRIHDVSIEERADIHHGINRWTNISIGLAAGVVVSSAVTALLWGRYQSTAEMTVQPTTGGATVSIGRSF